MSYTDHELERLILDVESELVERKASLQGDAPKKSREAICAFANDLQDHRRPGVLFVGVTDSGKPSSVDINDDLLKTLSEMKTDGNILPPPTLSVSKRVLNSAPVAVVLVEPSDAPPVRYKGSIWIRVGPRLAIASAQDERRLNEKRRSGDAPFDARPVRSASLADLDRRSFDEEYLPLAISPEQLAANARTYEQRLASCKMIASIDDPTPTLAGLLVLGKRPRDFVANAYVQFLRIGGNALGDPVLDAHQCDGPLAEMIHQIDEKLDSHNRVGVDFTSEATEGRIWTYPRAALQQLVRNAVLHRTYEATNAPVRITWFNDRLEIINPGGPFGCLTAQNFGEPGVTDYRNPVLAEAMRTLGLVQRFGLGIPTARKELSRAGHPDLEFNIDPNWIHCTVRARA